MVRGGGVEDEHSLVVAGDDGALAVGVPADGVRGEVLGERDGDAGGEEGGWVGETGGWEVEETEAGGAGEPELLGDGVESGGVFGWEDEGEELAGVEVDEFEAVVSGGVVGARPFRG
jgi:hypothetical protein